MKRILSPILMTLLATSFYASSACAAGGLEEAVQKLSDKNEILEANSEVKVIQEKERLVREYTNHLVENPGDFNVIFKLGVLYLWLTRQTIAHYAKADDMFARALNIDPSSGPIISDAYIDHIVDRIDAEKVIWLNNCFNSAIYADPSSKDRIYERIRPFAKSGNLTAISYAFICANGVEKEPYKQILVNIEYNPVTSISDYNHLEVAAIHSKDPEICLKAGQIAYHRIDDQFISAEERSRIEERIKRFLTPDQYQTIIFGSKPKFYKQYSGLGNKGGEYDDGTITTAENGVDYENGDLIIVTGESFDVYENGRYINYIGKYEKSSNSQNHKDNFFSIRAPKGVLITVKVIDPNFKSNWEIIQGSDKSFEGKGIGGMDNVLNIAQWGLEITNGHKIVIRSSNNKIFYVAEGGDWIKCSGKYERIIDFNPLYGNWFQAFAEKGTTLNFHIERFSSSF